MRHGFTLIELLVVVAVIGVLTGVLLPALATAREAGRTTECASNIRQLHLANDMHASDEGGRYVPGAARIQGANLHRWHGARESVGEAFDASRGPLTPYLDSGGASEALRACPSFAGVLEAREKAAGAFEKGCGGYGYNNVFVGTRRRPHNGAWVVQTDETGSLRARFMNPARTIGFADAAFAGDELIEYSFAEPRFWPEYDGFRPDPSIHFRHAGRARVVWLDGHVSSEELTKTHSSGLYPTDPASFGIGWFGRRDDNSLYDYR